MPDYARLYHILFNAITDALEQMEAGETEKARQGLMNAQRKTEELYIESEDK